MNVKLLGQKSSSTELSFAPENPSSWNINFQAFNHERVTPHDTKLASTCSTLSAE